MVDKMGQQLIFYGMLFFRQPGKFLNLILKGVCYRGWSAFLEVLVGSWQGIMCWRSGFKRLTTDGLRFDGVLT